MAVAGDASPLGHVRAHALYDRYYPNIYRYALSQLRSAQDAEDAAQNTFLRAFAAMQKGVVPENEEAWLFKIAHNVCSSSKLAWLRRRRVETPRDLELLPNEPEAIEPPREELEGLGAALANMPPRLREAFLLREWQGLSYAEIAERLDTSRSAVETLIFRARRHLANELQRVQTLWLGPLANWLRDFFGGGGAAVLRGAGIVVLAAGVTAAATVSVGNDRPARTGPQPVRAGGALVGALLPVQAQSRRRGRAAPAPAPQQNAAPHPQGASHRPLDVPLADAAEPGPASPALSKPAAAASVQTAATPAGGQPAGDGEPTPAQTATTTAATTLPGTPPLSQVTAPPATLPSTTVPSATVPSATVPTATLPTVTAPSVTVPPVTTPVVTTPGVTTPTVTTPTVTTPTVTTPSVLP